MADAPAAYVPPPHFQDVQDQINGAYKTALAKTQYQRSLLYTNAGFKDGSFELDPNSQYGGVQQLLHQEGQNLTADDRNAAHRGLGLDEGLGAQNASATRYGEHGQASDLQKTLTQGLQGYSQDDTDALTTKHNDTQTNVNNEADYNSSNAYNNALAGYLNSLGQTAPANTPGPAPIGSTPDTQTWATNPGGYNAGAPQNRPGATGKPTPGKVTLARPLGHI